MLYCPTFTTFPSFVINKLIDAYMACDYQHENISVRITTDVVRGELRFYHEQEISTRIITMAQ